MPLNYKFKAYFCPDNDLYVKKEHMNPAVSIIMGSVSDLKVMEKAAEFLDSVGIPFEINALSAHRTPEAVENLPRRGRQGNKSHYCRCRHGCTSAGSDSGDDSGTGHRRACQSLP